MKPIIASTALSELTQVLTARGAEVVTGDSVQSAISAITPKLRDGTVDAVLLICPDESARGTINIWARSMASFVSTRFVGVGDWEAAQVNLKPGCDLTRLLNELSLDAANGDERVTVSVAGELTRPHVESSERESSLASSASRFDREQPQHPGTSSAWGSSPAPGKQTSWGRHRDPAPVDMPAREAASALDAETVDSLPPVVLPWGGATQAHEGRIDSDWGNVVFLISGRGGVGRSTMAISIAEQAAGRLGRNVVLVDANIGQGGLATNLRVARDGAPSTLPTIADLVAGASTQQAVAGPKAVRASGGAAVNFASVLAPDPDQATPEASSPQHYRQVIDSLASVSDLVVVDTCVSWQKDPTGIASNLVAPGLRAGASALIVSDASLEGMEGVRRLAKWATRLAPGRVTGLLNMAPVSAVPDEASASKLFKPVPCLAVVPYDESVQVRAAKGQPIHRLPCLAADKILAHLGIA